MRDPKTPKQQEKASLLCAVVATKTGTGFVKLFGRGKTQPDKLASLRLSSLRRGMVIDANGQVHGFPLVVVKLPFQKAPKPQELQGEEAYTGWNPLDEWFWDQPLQYLKMFKLEATPKKVEMGELKAAADAPHAAEVTPWSSEPEVSQLVWRFFLPIHVCQ